MHKFQFFAIWNMVLAKKNRRSEIFVKSESSVLVTIIFLTDCYALTHFSYGLFAINFFVSNWNKWQINNYTME